GVGEGMLGQLRGWRAGAQPSRLHRVRQGARCEGATEPTVALRLGLWERTARTEILEQSTSARILSADVADAIEALVGPPERQSLPVAFDKNDIVQKLVESAHTDEDGIVHEQTAIAARSMTETFLNRLSIADRCPLSPHKRRKSGHFLTAASCQKQQTLAKMGPRDVCGAAF